MDQHIGRAELLARLARSYQRVIATLAPLTPAQLGTPGVVGDWSIKDVLAHFIAHEQFALAELDHARRGQRYEPGMADLDTINARAVAERQGKPAIAVLRDWQASYQQVVAAVQALPEADFDPAGPLAQALGDTIDGALGNNSYEHYAEHLPAIEAWLRALGSNESPGRVDGC